MRSILWTSIATCAAGVFLSCPASFAQEAANTGDVVLLAVDVDTQKPIRGVEFYKFNSLAEVWYEGLGSTDENGQLSFQSKPMPGYYFSVWQTPTPYKIVSLDEVASDVVAGRKVTHRFFLRAIPTGGEFPQIKDLPRGKPSQIPPPVKVGRSVQLESSVRGMPGFSDRLIRFRFRPDSEGKVRPNQLLLAERIFLNGSRVAAAVKDELTYFQKTVLRDKGQIENMNEILIEIDESSRVWTFWCRLADGLPLKQHGYRISFNGLDSWDLKISDYLQPGF